MIDDDHHDHKIRDDQEMCSGRHCENLATRATVRGEAICDGCADTGIDDGKLCERCDGVDFADAEDWYVMPDEPAAHICPNCWPAVKAEADKEAEIQRGYREEAEALEAIRAFGEARERLRALAGRTCPNYRILGGRTCLAHQLWLRTTFGAEPRRSSMCTWCQVTFLTQASIGAVIQ